VESCGIDVLSGRIAGALVIEFVDGRMAGRDFGFGVAWRSTAGAKQGESE
jgi:hypothetical protein